MNRIDIPRPNRLSARVAGPAAAGLVAMAALAGCSSGQIAETSGEPAAVNGTATAFNNVALRNVYIRADQTSDFLRPGKTVDLVLVAVNDSPDVADRLVGITTDIGTVTVGGDARLPAGGVLFVGTPSGDNVKQVKTIEAANAARATISLAKPITNGFTYPITFDFEKAGSATLGVPISAGVAPPPPEQTPAPAKHP